MERGNGGLNGYNRIKTTFLKEEDFMGILDGIKRQLRSVIEWQDPSPDILIWRWDGSNDELKNASKLLVNPGQTAIFVYEGAVKAVHDKAGLFELATANIPFWTTVTKFMQSFESEHKANIYFVRTTEFLDQKWGTKGPIKYEDPKYKFPVGLRAFGNFSFRIASPERFFVNIAGSRDYYSVAEVRTAMIDRMLTPLTDLMAESGFSYIEVDKNRVELSTQLAEGLKEVLAKIGFELTDFRIENTDFDEETRARINMIADKIAEAQAVSAMGQVDPNGMRNYATVEQLSALREAARNEGGVAGLGVGLGAGVGFGQAMGGIFAQNAQQPATAAPAATTASCAKCNAPLAADARFCPGCGTAVAQQPVCPSCAKPVAADAKFCQACGKPLATVCPACARPVPAGAAFCAACGEKLQ
jgi:membrane protease subunit (stomatin/prohibitin family)